MHQGFWATLPKPIIGLSPMDGVTDQPYRFLQKKYGQPDVVYTEFTSVEGLCHGADRLLQDFLFDETQRPIVAQIYGTTPNFFRQAATILCQLGFDGIDINMGCPAKNVAHSGAGAALIETPQLAQEIVHQTKAGVQDWVDGKTAADCPDIIDQIATNVAERHAHLPPEYQQKQPIPVTVKTRVGFKEKKAAEWAKILLETEPVVIAFHGRTLKQQYGGLADWDEIAAAAEVINQTDTMVFGNGDVASREDALHRAKQYNLDGILVGRASFGNPMVFLPADHKNQELSRFELALEHAKLYEQTFQDHQKYSFLPMRKHLGWYAKGVPGAKQLRVELFKTNSAAEVEETLTKFLTQL